MIKQRKLGWWTVAILLLCTATLLLVNTQPVRRMGPPGQRSLTSTKSLDIPVPKSLNSESVNEDNPTSVAMDVEEQLVEADAIEPNPAVDNLEVSSIQPPVATVPETVGSRNSMVDMVVIEEASTGGRSQGAASSESLFTIGELSELAQSGAQVSANRMLPGVVQRGGGVAPTPVATVRPDGLEQDADLSGTDLSERVIGQARGYVMLYLMHPRARPTVERQVQALLDSELHDLYLSVLVDGTFGKNYDYFEDVIRRLHQEDRSVTLLVYLTNGSTMRHHDVTRITAGFARTSPREFRTLIQYDPVTRAKVVALAEEAHPILELNTSLNSRSRSLVSVMLEDNLDSRSYKAMRDLVSSVLIGTAEFVRNPCQGCYPGNDSDGQGDAIEFHRPSELLGLGPRDGFTLDGVGHNFPWEPDSPGLAYTEVKNLLDVSYAAGVRYFGLWRFQRQGLGGSVTPHPDDRDYEVPDDAQLALEVEMLRFGLSYLVPHNTQGDY